MRFALASLMNQVDMTNPESMILRVVQPRSNTSSPNPLFSFLSPGCSHSTALIFISLISTEVLLMDCLLILNVVIYLVSEKKSLKIQQSSHFVADHMVLSECIRLHSPSGSTLGCQSFRTLLSSSPNCW